MESQSLEFALYYINNECTRTNNVFFPLPEVSNGAISLLKCNIKEQCDLIAPSPQMVLLLVNLITQSMDKIQWNSMTFSGTTRPSLVDIYSLCKM